MCQLRMKTVVRRKWTQPGMGYDSQGKCAELRVVKQVGVEVGEEAAGKGRRSVERLVAVQVDERDQLLQHRVLCAKKDAACRSSDAARGTQNPPARAVVSRGLG